MYYSFTHFRVGSSDIGRLLFANSLSSVLGVGTTSIFHAMGKMLLESEVS